ncbi:hypothetical protein GA0070558_12859 [Micromonospora haikouensis]|uniref:SUKH-4 immunity protein n=1 Tax=Micromonospora haikouensis TaxID=686309 RepID=A0A1C4XQH3_9ACTN|nr:hypothetical protein [Micromonospora haikouensis]SCF10341.1 hypothetical protein GA0070558_12859 [Micromonospora haikouensis]
MGDERAAGAKEGAGGERAAGAKSLLLGRIAGEAWIVDLLRRFDFDLDRAADGPPEAVHLPNGEPLEMIAGDASGGAFMLVGDDNGDDNGDGVARPVLYVGSEGEGGLIATDLRAALSLVVGLSSVHDATSVPYGDDGGARLREWLARADEEIREDWPELDAERARLRQALDLPEADGLLEALHRLAADEDYRPVSDAGDRYEAMVDAPGA